MIEMPIATYFAQSEENIASFRQLEQQILQELAQYTRVVISTGGGIVERNENWGYLRHGIVVWINMLPEEIYERLRAKPEEIAKRPLLKGDNPLGKLQELHEKRLDKYQQADITVDVARDATPEQLAELVAVKILTFIKANPPLWKTWSQKRSENALEAAGLMNPAAASTKGFGNQEKKGSIKYVSMQDIQSGKVKLPDGVQIPFPNGLPKDEQ
jgi:shikimate kinase